MLRHTILYKYITQVLVWIKTYVHVSPNDSIAFDSKWHIFLNITVT